MSGCANSASCTLDSFPDATIISASDQLGASGRLARESSSCWIVPLNTGDCSKRPAPMRCHCAPWPVNTPRTRSGNLGETDIVPLASQPSALNASSLSTSSYLEPAENVALNGNSVRRDCSVHAKSSISILSAASLSVLDRADTPFVSAVLECAESIKGPQVLEKLCWLGLTIFSAPLPWLSPSYADVPPSQLSIMTCAFVPPNPKLLMLARLGTPGADIGHGSSSVGTWRCG